MGKSTIPWNASDDKHARKDAGTDNRPFLSLLFKNVDKKRANFFETPPLNCFKTRIDWLFFENDSGMDKFKHPIIMGYHGIRWESRNIYMKNISF